MFYVATLISSPDRPVVTDALVQKVARYLPHGRPVDWLAPGVATDIAFLLDELDDPPRSGEDKDLLKDLGRRYSGHHRRHAGRCRYPAA